jgi:hypothetical protein
MHNIEELKGASFSPKSQRGDVVLLLTFVLPRSLDSSLGITPSLLGAAHRSNSSPGSCPAKFRSVWGAAVDIIIILTATALLRGRADGTKNAWVPNEQDADAAHTPRLNKQRRLRLSDEGLIVASRLQRLTREKEKRLQYNTNTIYKKGRGERSGEAGGGAIVVERCCCYYSCAGWENVWTYDHQLARSSMMSARMVSRLRRPLLRLAPQQQQQQQQQQPRQHMHMWGRIISREGRRTTTRQSAPNFSEGVSCPLSERGLVTRSMSLWDKHVMNLPGLGDSISEGEKQGPAMLLAHRLRPHSVWVCSFHL